ncbi:triose-phosphate isomerase [Kineosporia sp. J2-2]|uniref:Triosephosphate isomerase n=1 Tax=Kineosporia corallincola TaxID=2835133 RepID=A0ABS5TCN7_9ACTN|nr:triose-phosphate isomerase [Kineosporia corallincola]MBT0768843.1 triose-phosphate isomerase [Kineosporia corallincola]
MAKSDETGRTPLMAGNWKMNLDHFEAAHLVQKLAWTLDDAKHDFDAVEVALIPPFTDLRSVQTLVDGDKLGFKYGAQDLSQYDKGAYTGEISGAMLAKLKCTYVVVGHSERRQYHNEDDAVVNAKTKAAIKHDLTPVVCIGEGLDVRKEGRQVPHCLAQLDADLAGVPADKAASIVIAYEPVWAIGTGEVATPEDAQEVCAAIRGRLAELYSADVAKAVRVLYGGSVKAQNVAGIMAQEDVDGALVGGASIDPGEFASIVRYRDHKTA